MEMDMQAIANIFSIITIFVCFILKIPQIWYLMAIKSAVGIPLLGLMLELTSYTVMTSYNYTNGYALLTYLEYPVILAQEFLLIYLVLKYRNQVNNIKSIFFAICYFVLSTCILIQVVPKYVLTILAPMCTPISASSKLVQLLAIVRAKNADSVSLLTWFISAFTNTTRIFTIWVDSGDILLLGNCIISSLLSSSIMFSALYYKSRSKRDDGKYVKRE
ncbi:PQ-loop repeat-containing protein 3 [Diachasma alloeum]|uniref:PQ-loop repeat-containing protein 3 n=1 Tax=Diachasma alloeum TaxID=454923 RepID=UPI0007382B3D|nr:PQ-loop repeat-containing protein 3 [Diachasma alloeum]XP_028982457.1 PQ-loop repeat-containing protein 3 [Diachasma alloeum]